MKDGLYGSLVETGIRGIVLLESLRPVAASFTELVLFDHVVVHTDQDQVFGAHGPTSLVPGRS